MFGSSSSWIALHASACCARQLVHQMAIVSMKITFPARSAIRNVAPLATSVRLAVAQGCVSTMPGAGSGLGAALVLASAEATGDAATPCDGGGAAEGGSADEAGFPLAADEAPPEQAATRTTMARSPASGRVRAV